MTDTNVEPATGLISAVALSGERDAEATKSTKGGFSYCGGCGTWDAHGLRCSCCGYDFHAEPIEKLRAGD